MLEHAHLQTKVLEINLVTFPNVADAILQSIGKMPLTIRLKGVCILKRLLINRERMTNVMNGTKNGLYFSASVCIIVGHPDIYSTEWYSEEDDQAVLPEEGLTKSVLSRQLAAIIKANLIRFSAIKANSLGASVCITVGRPNIYS
ncbi:hypothetical protein Tco_0280853 [Tanacetum coccineum]